MTAATKANDWVDYMVEGVHLATDQMVVALSNTAPASETPFNPLIDTRGTLSNVSEISYTNASSRNLTTTSSSQASGTYKQVIADLTITASGGTVGPFRYVYVYDDTVAGDPIVCVYDYGSSITLNSGEDILLDFSAANGFIQVT